MLLKEAKQKLRINGYKLIKEDTDDWDEDDLGLDAEDRHFTAAKHNYFTHRALSTKVNDALKPHLDWKTNKREFINKLIIVFNKEYGDNERYFTKSSLFDVIDEDELMNLYYDYKGDVEDVAANLDNRLGY